ncbi:MAG: ABC transporter substrate-binding protein [Chloroflexi bacterium]|nr:ABC transporter substrate-binding protein [Chloroflexota bacterium]
MPKRIVSLTLSIIVALGLAACGGQVENGPQAEQPVNITLYMGFQPDVQFAPFYVGVEEGFFAEQGLTVSFRHDAESTITRLVATDEIPFGIVSGEQVLLARAQGAPLVYVYEWYQQFAVAVATKEGSGIVTVNDLAGRSVGVPMAEGASYIGLRALLAGGGLSESDIDLRVTGFAQVETLVTDQVDAVVVYLSNEPIQLDRAGVTTTVIPVTDYADLVANGVITSERTIQENSELVQAFVNAFDAALAFTLENPDRAFEVSRSYVEGMSDPAIAEVQREVLERSLPLWSAPRLGETSPASWIETQDVLLSMGLLDQPIELEAAYTTDFLPE